MSSWPDDLPRKIEFAHGSIPVHEYLRIRAKEAPEKTAIIFYGREISYKELSDGNIEKKVLRKRPGTVGISAAIKYKYKVEVVPHIICGGFNREETENGLIDLHFLEIYNLLAIRGDNLPGDKFFKPEKGGNQYTLDLIRQIKDLNRGIYQDNELVNNAKTNFSVGVAGYPEKHSEAPNMKTDIRHLKEKIDAGGEYIVTQMFFDNRKYFDFVSQCREAGITVPIIPGLKPISTIGQINTLPRTFNISIPEDLQKEIEKCKDNREARQVGIEWCLEQSKELMKAKVPALHYFTMGKSDNIREIVKGVL